MPNSDIEVMLYRIGQRVLDDVWISRRTTVVALGTSVALGGAATAGWLTDTHGVWISRVAVALFALMSAVSSVALWRRRFRWCCAAAYTGGLSTVVGLGGIWWHQTAPAAISPGPSVWMVVGVLCAAALTAGWLRLILTPLVASQPDSRAGAAAAV
ncbi:hypothetical protein ACXDF8_10465 [Mycolicibacterium sp. CBM1]